MSKLPTHFDASQISHFTFSCILKFAVFAVLKFPFKLLRRKLCHLNIGRCKGWHWYYGRLTFERQHRKHVITVNRPLLTSKYKWPSSSCSFYTESANCHYLESLMSFARWTKKSGNKNSATRVMCLVVVASFFFCIFVLSLDVQSTAALDADLETQRQNMFVKALKLLARKLRVKREISSEQENKVSLRTRR